MRFFRIFTLLPIVTSYIRETALIKLSILLIQALVNDWYVVPILPLTKFVLLFYNLSLKFIIQTMFILIFVWIYIGLLRIINWFHRIVVFIFICLNCSKLTFFLRVIDVWYYFFDFLLVFKLFDFDILETAVNSFLCFACRGSHFIRMESYCPRTLNIDYYSLWLIANGSQRGPFRNGNELPRAISTNIILSSLSMSRLKCTLSNFFEPLVVLLACDAIEVSWRSSLGHVWCAISLTSIRPHLLQHHSGSICGYVINWELIGAFLSFTLHLKDLRGHLHFFLDLFWGFIMRFCSLLDCFWGLVDRWYERGFVITHLKRLIMDEISWFRFSQSLRLWSLISTKCVI